MEQLHMDEMSDGAFLEARPDIYDLTTGERLDGGLEVIPIPQDIDENPLYEGLMLLEPRNEYDQCIIGVVERFHDRFVLYSKRCVMEQLTDVKVGLQDYDDAQEFFDFNIIGGWVGEHTPGFLEDEDE